MVSVMVSDLIFQAIFIFTIIFMFLWMLNIPQKLYDKFQFRDRSSYAAKRHFVRGANLLAKSRSTKDRTTAVELAKSAVEEADKSIAINPNDAVVHLLKGIALDAQGFTTSALESIDVSLSPLTAKSLDDGEKSDALLKRAEIKMKVSKDGGVESAVTDLTESVRLNGDNVTALLLLGECYEKKEMKGEALKVYMAAVKVEPRSAVAQAALLRLGSTSKIDIIEPTKTRE